MILCGPTTNSSGRKYIRGRVLVAAAKKDDQQSATKLEAELNTKRFTRPSDTSLVKELVESLVKKFSHNGRRRPRDKSR